MPTLAIAFEFPTLLGGERSMLTVLQDRPPDGWDVVAIAPPIGPLAKTLASLEIPVVALDLRRDGNKPPPEFAAALLEDAVRQIEPDVLHANSLSMSRTTGRLAKQTGRVTTGHLRDIIKLSRTAVDDINANQHVICVSHATRDFHTAQGLDPVRSSVIYNTVRVEPATRSPGWLRGELGLSPDIPLIATIGQICLRKGQDLAAQVLAELGDVEWRWLLIGERYSQKAESIAFDESIEAILEAAGLSDRLIRLGYRDDMPDIYREIDLVVHCARQEPLGRVLLEAKVYEVSTVASKVGGTKEVLAEEACFSLGDAAPDVALLVEQCLADRQSTRSRISPISGTGTTAVFWQCMNAVNSTLA